MRGAALPTVLMTRHRWVWTMIALLVVMLAVACSDPTTESTIEQTQELGAGELFNAGVTVSGKATEVLDSGAIVLSGDDVSFGGGTDTLVLPDTASEVDEGDFVRVRGTLLRLAADGLRDEEMDRYDDALGTYDGQFVMRAEAVEAIEPPGQEASALERALDDPETEIRETLTLSARVQEVMSPQVLWIAGTGSDGVPVVTENRPEVDTGDVVELTGTIMRFDPATIQQETGIALRSDVAEQVSERLASDVVFVADFLTLANVADG